MRMAKNMRQMKGWQYIFEEDASPASESPKRALRSTRSSRSKDPQIILRRSEDNLEVKVGDILLISDEEDEEDSDRLPSIGLVRDISFGTDSFLDVSVLWFYRLSEIDKDNLPETFKDHIENDAFLCPVTDKIMLTDILQKCVVISQATLSKTMIDESNFDTTFVCRRFCDSDGEYFTESIDWDKMHKQFVSNPKDFYILLKNLTVKPTVKQFSKKLEKKGIDPRSLKLEEKKLAIKQRKQKRKRRRNYAEDESSDDDEDFYVYDFASEDDDEDDELEEEEEENNSDIEYVGSRTTRKVKIPRKHRRTRRRRTTKKKPTGPKLPTIPRGIEVSEDARELDIDAMWDEEEGCNKRDSKTETSRALRKAKKVLRTSAKLHSLPCREEEFSKLFYTLESAVQSEVGRCIYVSGTPGVGKTATIREVIKQLSALLITQTHHKMFNYVEINGLKLVSPQASYEALWKKVSGLKVTSSAALPLLEEYFNKEDSNRNPLVVLLDEMDQIVTKNQSVMYNFFNWPSYQNSKLIVIAVANTMDLPERMLTNKISSRLGLTRIQFQSYTYTQLSQIIKSRLEQIGRLNDDKMVISKDAIAFASRKVASVSGDARRALMICIRGIEIAETEFSAKSAEERKKLDGKYTVTIMHIMKAVNETASSPISNYLGSLSFMSKMFLASILLRMRRSGMAEVTVGDIIDELNNQFHVMLFTDLKKRLADEDLSAISIIYGNNIRSQLRPQGLGYIIKDLEENGILIVQQIRLARSRLVRLNVSQDEVINSFKRDTLIKEIVVAR